MTRRKRELERALDDLDGDTVDNTGGLDVSIKWGADDTGADDDTDVTVRYKVVIGRERAEREGREILRSVDGPGDLVQVRWDGRDDR